MHRMRYLFARAGLAFVIAAAAAAASPTRAHAELIRPNAAQSFPDLGGDLVGSQAFTYDSTSQTGTFVVNNAPSLLALGPNTSGEFFVTDPPGKPRSESIQVKLDSTGNLVSDPSNSFSLYGSVSIEGSSVIRSSEQCNGMFL